MATDRIGTVYMAGARHYIIEETGIKAPGVTSILNMTPKPFLAPWAVKLSAEYAVDNAAAVMDIASRDRQSAIDLIKGASKRSTAGSADVGTEVHDYLEARLLGNRTPTLSVKAQEFVPAIDDWFTKWKPEPVLTECSVWGSVPAGPYAGSFDGIVKICGEDVLIDWKTGKSVHAESAIQLACYRYSTAVIGGGTLPNIDACAVVHVRPDVVKLHPVAATPDKLEIFDALYRVWQWTNNNRGDVGKALLSPPAAK